MESFLQQMFDLQQKAFAIYFDDKRFIRNIYTRCASESRPPATSATNNSSLTIMTRLGITTTSREFRVAAHNKCNLALRRTCRIPVFVHNFRCYDSHFSTNALNRFGGEEILVIGQGMEKCLTITMGKHIIFKDSLEFMGANLQTLGSNLLKAVIGKFVNLKKE